MCNYSKGVYNDGMERGRNTGIAGAADILKRMGMDAGKIVEQLMLQYGLAYDTLKNKSSGFFIHLQ